jgi:CRP-like cAMP-binding protein
MLRQMKNHLIASLPTLEQKPLLRHLEPIHFGRKRILYEAGQAMHDAYFFESGMASLVTVAEDGQAVQVAIVGTNGFVGVPIILMSSKTPVRIVTQTPVEAVKINAEQLLEEFNRRRHLREALLRYSQVLQTQTAQSVLCSSLHTIQGTVLSMVALVRRLDGVEEFRLHSGGSGKHGGQSPKPSQFCGSLFGETTAH